MTTVETAAGRISGRADGGVVAFRGIPYAAAPVGELRWRAPRPAPAWSGVLEAHECGPWAPQLPSLTTLSGQPPGPMDESCLTLNVWTPAADGGRRPVLVWIHGGAFTGGSGASPLYDGARLAATGDVVVVTVNYRLGLLGFLAHPDLADEVEGGAAANWGLLDQIAALRWVHESIAGFGGDPANVTLFGESAGGMSVSALLAAPSARGLFAKAIVQSGPPTTRAHDRAVTQAEELAASLGRPGPAALRDLPVDALLQAQGELLSRRGTAGLPLAPTVDGTVLSTSPLAAVAAGAAADVPLVVGTNRDEAKMFMIGDPANRDPDEATLLRRISRIFAVNEVPLDPADVIAAYRDLRGRRGQPTTPRELWSAIETDRVFRVGSARLLAAQAAHQPHTYSYLFTWESPAMGGALGSCHALEIPFVFGTLAAPTMDRFAGSGPAADALSAAMMQRWLAFARSGSPAVEGGEAWPAYDDSRRATMVFDAQVRVQDAPNDEELALWP